MSDARVEILRFRRRVQRYRYWFCYFYFFFWAFCLNSVNALVLQNAPLVKRNSLLNSRETVSSGYVWTSVIFFCVHAQKEQICIVSFLKVVDTRKIVKKWSFSRKFISLLKPSPMSKFFIFYLSFPTRFKNKKKSVWLLIVLFRNSPWNLVNDCACNKYRNTK